MEEVKHQRPWEIVKSLIEGGDESTLTSHIEALTNDELVLVLSHLSKEEISQLITLLPPEEAADIIGEIHEEQAADLLEAISTVEAAAILGELKSNEQVDLINEFEEDNALAIIAQMKPEEAENVKKLIQYAPDTAGGLMITEFLAFDELSTVREVTDHLREKAEEYAHYNVQYIYVVGKKKFAGVLQLRDLVLTRPEELLTNISIRDALTVATGTSLDELINFFDTYDFYGVPVLNDIGELVGVVLRKDILKEETEMASKELLETQGIVGGEELRTMPFLLRARRRLSWLSVNILLNIVAASVIAMHQDTLSAVIALAVFLPIISDMSGCSGNQAVAVSLRELSLGVVKPFEMRRVWLQEISVGTINGLALGGLLGFAAWLWQGNIYLGIVVGLALWLNTMIAVSIGGTVPLLLKKMDIDPALASGPILTTITDMVGFFLALSFAAIMLSKLGML